ncbi:hypothetical protein Tco_1461117, partial [Tanacetum coccineum]
IDKFVHDPNKTPDSSQRPPIFEKKIPKCGDPVEGLYCRQCALIRKKLKEVFQDFQDTSESSNDNPNVVNVPQDPFVLNQDPGENPSQSPPHIDHNCCYKCGDSLDRIFCQRCTCVSCGKGAHYGYNCLPKIPICYDDDDDEESSIPLRDIIMSELPSCVAITPILTTKEPVDSLIIEDEHLDTISETESDEFIKSSVKNLIQNPSESKDFSDIESECDVPVCENFTTFSNLLFDANDDFSSSDDESFSDEDVPKEIYSNPLFDEEIISTKIDPHHFNAESDLIESFLNQDTSIISSPKIDSLLEEFSDEVAYIDLIPPGINETDFDPEEEIRLVEKLLYDNSSPRPLEEFNFENSDAIIESFSPSPIPIEGSDSLMEEIDLFLTLDDSIPPGIENDDYDFEGDILFLEELLSNDSPSLPENESFHFDFPSSPRPPAKPSYDGIYFEPDIGLLIAKVVDDISDNSTRELYVHVSNVLPNLPTLSPMFDTLLPFSPKNENKVFNSSILASDEEKSPHPLSHRGFKAFQVISDFF